MTRETYPSDVTDDDWAFIAPYLTLMREDAPQRDHDLPPWYTAYQQGRRWIEAGVFEDMVHDLRALLSLAKGKNEQSTAAIFDGRTMQSTPESGERAGYDGHKKKGSGLEISDNDFKAADPSRLRLF